MLIDTKGKFYALLSLEPNSIEVEKNAHRRNSPRICYRHVILPLLWQPIHYVHVK